MDKLLRLTLIVTGVCALIVMTVPGILVFAYLALIIPGVILSLMPTAFMWLVTFSVMWWPMRSRLSLSISNALALAGTLAIFWLLPQASIASSRAEFSRIAADQDVFPDKRLALSGDIKVIVPHLDMAAIDPDIVKRDAADYKEILDRWVRTRPKNCDGVCISMSRPNEPYHREKYENRAWGCDALCVALLATPGITSVTVDLPEKGKPQGYFTTHARTFRLIPKAKCPGKTVQPQEPGALNVDRPTPAGGRDVPAALSLNAEWDLRLSTRECIIEQVPLVKSSSTLAVTNETRGLDETKPNSVGYDWSFGPYPTIVNRMSLTSSNGTILLRKTLASSEIMTRFLYIGITEHGVYNFHFQWVHTGLSNGKRFEELRPHQFLADHTNLYTGGDQVSVMAGTREKLEQMVHGGSIEPNDPALRLLEPWFASFSVKGATVSAPDRKLLIQLVADERITHYPALYAPIRAMGADAALLRPIIGRRLAVARPPYKWTSSLASQYGGMPEGIMTTTTADERLILSDPDRRMYAGGLILRQTDKGSAAVPLLLEIMQTHWTRLRAPARKTDGDGDRVPIDAARMALCQLGPRGSSALAALEKMTSDRLIDVNLIGDRDWNYMLARIGKSLKSIEKPTNLSGTQANFESNLRERLERFKPEQSCQAYWGY